MGYEENKAVYRRFVEEVINGGNSDVVEELFSPDYADHNAPPGAPPGLDAVRMVPKMFRGAFPDVHFQIEDMVAEGDRVATRVVGSGTHQGAFLGTPPTGNHARWGSTGIFRVADGKIVEHWGQPDLLALMSQIGTGPPGVILPPDESGRAARPDTPPGDPYDAALLERNKDVIRRLHDEGFTKGNAGLADEIVATDFVDRPPARFFELPNEGPEWLRSAIKLFRGGFPDLTQTIEDLIAEGNRVVSRSVMRGTHTGEFGQLAPTSKEVEVTFINFFRLDDEGRIVERHGSFDALGLLQQLGMGPPGPGPGAH